MNSRDLFLTVLAWKSKGRVSARLQSGEVSLSYRSPPSARAPTGGGVGSSLESPLQGPLSNPLSMSLVADCKESPVMWETWVQFLGGEDLLRREWQPTPVFLPGDSHGQRSLVGNGSWGHKESDTTEQPTLSIPSWGLHPHGPTTSQSLTLSIRFQPMNLAGGPAGGTQTFRPQQLRNEGLRVDHSPEGLLLKESLI